MRIDYSKLKCYCGSCGWKSETIPGSNRSACDHTCPRCGSSRIMLYERTTENKKKG